MPGFLLLVQTVAIAASAVAAFFMVKSSTESSKKRATVQALLQLRLDNDYIQQRDAFKKLIKDEDSLAKFASSEHRDSDSTMLIYRILNYHEYMATGTLEGAFDEEIYKRMSYSQVVRDWERLQAFVTEMRRQEKNTTFYQEFQTLATTWKASQLPTRTINNH